MSAPIKHAFHPNTFGLIYGKTTKTACGRRVRTELICRPLDTTCEKCQDAVIAELARQQETVNVVRDMMRAASDAWCATHPTADGDDRSPLEMYDAKLIGAREFWSLVYDSLPQPEPGMVLLCCTTEIPYPTPQAPSACPECGSVFTVTTAPAEPQCPHEFVSWHGSRGECQDCREIVAVAP